MFEQIHKIAKAKSLLPRLKYFLHFRSFSESYCVLSPRMVLFLTRPCVAREKAQCRGEFSLYCKGHPRVPVLLKSRSNLWFSKVFTIFRDSEVGILTKNQRRISHNFFYSPSYKKGAFPQVKNNQVHSEAAVW